MLGGGYVGGGGKGRGVIFKYPLSAYQRTDKALFRELIDLQHFTMNRPTAPRH
jgi:hypothetical protein